MSEYLEYVDELELKSVLQDDHGAPVVAIRHLSETGVCLNVYISRADVERLSALAAASGFPGLTFLVQSHMVWLVAEDRRVAG